LSTEQQGKEKNGDGKMEVTISRASFDRRTIVEVDGITMGVEDSPVRTLRCSNGYIEE